MHKNLVKLFLAPDTGADGGTPETVETTPDNVEAEKTKAELKEAKAKLAAYEKAQAEAKKAKMTEDEKKAAEQDAFEKEKEALRSEYRLTQIAKVGLDQEYAPLIQGNTLEEITASGALLAKLVTSVKAETEKAVKATVAHTGAPVATGSETTEINDEEYYKSLIGGNN